MKYAVIDVGSNSVRLMLSDGEQTLVKVANTTKLAEGMGEDKKLTKVAINRTVLAVYNFCEIAKKEMVDKVYLFATAAVRSAVNGEEFCDAVKNACGVMVDVVSGAEEARLGLLGALNGRDGGIIDVGGASTEISVVKNGETVYSRSVDIGAVTVKDLCGQDVGAVEKFVESKILEYGALPTSNFYSIGGTATSVAAMLQELEPYDPKKTHGFKVYINNLIALKEKLFSMTVDERKSLKGLRPERAEVIAGGVAILVAVMKKLGVDYVTVSENDNLEGYLKVKLEKV